MEKRIKKYYRIIISTLLLVVIGLSIFLYHARDKALVLVKQQFNEQQSLLAKQTAIGIEENFVILVRELELLSKMCPIKEFDIELAQVVMAESYDHVKKHFISNIGLIDSVGTLRLALNSPQFIGRDFSDHDYFIEASILDKSIPVFKFNTFSIDDAEEDEIVIAMPVFADQGDFRGVILFSVSLPELIGGISSGADGDIRTWVIEGSGNILYHPQLKTGTNFHELPDNQLSLRTFLASVVSGPGHQTEYITSAGEEIIAATYPAIIADQEWFVVIATSENKISSLLFEFNSLYAVVTIIALLTIISGALFMIYLVSGWNKELHQENSERIHAEEELQKAHDELESRIKERTAELEDLNVHLEQQIEERKSAEEKLSEQNKFVRSTIESLTHPFYVIDAENYRIQLANSAAGFGELQADSTCFALTHDRSSPCDGRNHPCTIREIKKKNQPVTLVHTHQNQEGEARIFEVHGYPIFDSQGKVQQVIEYTVDITDRKKLEEQLQHSQKMESIGRLAGGIAHDFNNILTAIIGYSELAKTRLPENNPVMNDLKIIREAGDKAAILVRQLLAFSRKQILEMKVVNLNELVNDIIKLFSRVIGEDILLDVNTDKRVGNIKADPSQLEQILMNLVVNARDAMPQGGRISIETTNVELDEEYTKNHDGVVPGSYVMIAVTDSGKGMSREVQEKIFEPFFTTKGHGGTGLGLSIVYGIVKQHKGHVFVYSEKDIGTTFKVYFPATLESSQPAKFTAMTSELNGDETILVVDDDSSIRKLILDTMQPLGYHLIDASCAEEVLEFLEHSDQELDLLLTDMVMPGMNGRDLAKAVRNKFPDIKVVFMSGYTDEMITNHGILEIGETFVQKPLSPIKLAGKLRTLLGKK